MKKNIAIIGSGFSSLSAACYLAKSEKIVKKGDYVVITAGAPIGVSGSTNNLRIAKIN